MMRGNEKDPCRFAKRGCLFVLSGCTYSSSADCGEAVRRERLEKIPCPLMKGQKGNLGCDIPDLRALISTGEPCNQDKDCLPRKIEEAQLLINSHVNDRSPKLSEVARSINHAAKKLGT
jgi:hypothetical protein